MSRTVIKIENLSKQYRLGIVGTGTLAHDINRWWANIRGKQDPTLKIGQENIISEQLSVNNEQTDYVWALKNINLEINEGDVLGIIGKNGAGKSTFLKLLSRITAPTTGLIKVKGRITSLLEIGTGFHRELTGRENVFLNGAILGMTKREIQSKFDEILDFAGVEKYIDTPVKRYSSGMYVRLAFAVAAHLESEILIVDEVLAVGDAEFRKKALEKMKDVSSGQGRTVLFVSHNMASIEKLSNRGLYLRNGSIELINNNINTVINKYIQSQEQAQPNRLLELKERTGSGKLLFKEIAFFDNYNNKIQTLYSGRKVRIKLNYIATQQINNLEVAIGFNTWSGENKMTLWNKYVDKNYNITDKTGTIECIINKFPLTGGSYALSIMARADNETIDWLKYAIQITVESGDFYDTGKIAPGRYQGVLVEQDWI